jgi:hypothetical protein
MIFVERSAGNRFILTEKLKITEISKREIHHIKPKINKELTYFAEVLAVARFIPVTGTFAKASERESVEGSGEHVQYSRKKKLMLAHDAHL